MGDDARLELWEELCQCGGARKSPDVRMCSCNAPFQAGLICHDCGAGVFLIKSGWRGKFFWGCSMYRKKGCKNTMKFGPPHDSAARAQLTGRYRDPAMADYARISRAGATARSLQSSRTDSDLPSDVEVKAWLQSQGMEDMFWNLRTPIGCGFLAWHIAGQMGRVDICRWLFARGVGDLINAQSEAGHTALSFCVGSHGASYRPGTRYIKTAKWLLAQGANPALMTPKDKATLQSMLPAAVYNKRSNMHVQADAPKPKKRKLTAAQRARMEKNRLACLERKRQKQAEREASKKQVDRKALNKQADREISKRTALSDLDLTNKTRPRGVMEAKSCPATGSSADAVCAANQKLVNILTELAQLGVQLKKTTRARTYQKAARAIAKCGFEITSGLQVSKGEQKIKGIGKSTAEKIDEIIRTGSVVEVVKWRAIVVKDT